MANNDMHIGFDLDGVLVDHTNSKKILARSFGYELTDAQTSSDGMRAAVPDIHRHEIQRMLYQDALHALTSGPMTGSRELLTELAAHGIRFTLISRRRNHDLARKLLDTLGLRPDFFTDANTVFVDSVDGKAETCARLGITHYIDDESGVLAALTTVPHRYLMDPFGVNANAPWPRVSTLGAFRDIILAHD